MKKVLLLKFFALVFVAGSCQGRTSSEKIYESNDFKKYWYSGKAEINSYNLNQSRYQEQRSGKAVLIFVTEDFSQQKHVKLDEPSKAGSDKVNVLKFNFTKSFITGIYPYSMMQSVFTPMNRRDHPHTLKTTMSSQEWCGHVFTQLNLKEDVFEVKSFSYFENEGDANFTVKKILLEDELWNIIRLDHTSLPVGEIKMIPGSFFTRLNHVELAIQSATASKTETNSSYTYVVTIPGQKRTLAIQYEKKFPYKILGWKEDFEERGIRQHTIASLDKTLVTDYWTKNKNEFQYLRDSLNLSSPR